MRLKSFAIRYNRFMSDEALRILLRKYLATRDPEDAVAFAESYARHEDPTAFVWIVSISENNGENNYQSTHLTELGAVTMAADWVLERLEHDLIDADEQEVANLENLERNFNEAITRKDTKTLDKLVEEYNTDLPRGTEIQVYRQMVL
jgi:hypothetical protein